MVHVHSDALIAHGNGLELPRHRPSGSADGVGGPGTLLDTLESRVYTPSDIIIKVALHYGGLHKQL